MSHKMHCHLEECCFWWADNKAISATHCQDAVQITLQNCICGARFHYSESFQNLLCNTVPLYSALLDGWNYLPLCLHAIWWAETVPKTKVIAPRLVHHTQFVPIWVQRISQLLFDWHGCHLAGHLSTTHPYCILSAYIVSSACNPMTLDILTCWNTFTEMVKILAIFFSFLYIASAALATFYMEAASPMYIIPRLLCVDGALKAFSPSV